MMLFITVYHAILALRNEWKQTCDVQTETKLWQSISHKSNSFHEYICGKTAQNLETHMS